MKVLRFKKNLGICTVILFMGLAGAQGNLFADVSGAAQAGRSAKTGSLPSDAKSAEPQSENQAGVAASVQGEVKATTPPAKSAHLLKSGDKIFMGDKIETGADGQLQILLLDQTVFSLGPLSAISVDEFVYDPENAGDKAGMVKGIFRAVSGKVSSKKQEAAAENEALLNSLDAFDHK